MIDEKETQLVIQRYTELKTERSKYIPRWKEIQKERGYMYRSL